MRLFKKLTLLTLALLLVVSIIVPINCTTEEKFNEVAKEELDEGYDSDYQEFEDESENDSWLQQGSLPYPPLQSSPYAQVPTSAYQAPAYQQQPQVLPPLQQQAPVYQQHPQVVTEPAYQPVQQVAYQQPKEQVYQQPQVVYQQETTYQPPPQPTYQNLEPIYQPIQANQPVPVPTYQPISSPPAYLLSPPLQKNANSLNYTSLPYPAISQVYRPQPVVETPILAHFVQSYQTNYSAPAHPPQVNYSVAPIYKPPHVNNHIAPVYQPPIVTNYTKVVGNYSGNTINQHQQSSIVANKYSVGELASMVPFTGYRGNHWSLYYYRSSPYTTCPKGNYLKGPSYQDIEAAFISAQQQLAIARGTTIQFLNSTQPSWTARHQVFSFLSQQNARMDEEGLLVELVSQYLADRACLTKWDKQRYLPQLTKFVSVTNFPGNHACSNLYKNNWQTNQLKTCVQSKYRTFDGFCNNPYHPYWGKANVCHIRLLSPDYADGISKPRNSYNSRFPLPNPRVIASTSHNDVPLEGPYNLMKMQWGQFINHDITNTALSSYDGLVDCCKNPDVRGCWPIYVPPSDRFYGPLNVTCLNFIRSGVCPLCQLGPRQQLNKNSAFLDASHVYGHTVKEANSLRAFQKGLLKTSSAKNGDVLLPIVEKGQDQCFGQCFLAGDARVNQHPALTVLHTLLLRNHNHHALKLSHRHPEWNDEILYQEARRINIAEYQMITHAEYFPLVFGPILSAYYHLIPQSSGYTYYDSKADPTTWNEYSTATCRFGHSQIASTYGLYHKIYAQGQIDAKQPTYPLRQWFMRPSFLIDGLTSQILNGLLSRPSMNVDPWISGDVRNHLYKSHKEHSGGDLAATNIWRGRDHGLPGYVHYVEYCFNYKVRGWKDLNAFIPPYALNQLRKLYKVVENIDLFTGGLAERHFPGADIGPTFACVNGIQYYHLKFGDRYYFEHGGQSGSFSPTQLNELRQSTLAKMLCRAGKLHAVPQFAFLQPSNYNPLVNCSSIGDLNYGLF